MYDRPRSQHWNGTTMSSSERLSNLLKAPTCPRCSATMWLSRLEPHPNGTTDNMVYDCACGEQLTRTVKTR